MNYEKLKPHIGSSLTTAACLILSAGSALSSCGSSSDKVVSNTTGPGSGYVVSGDSEIINVEFPESPDNQVYVVMPFSVGNLASVDGGTPGEGYSVTWTIGESSSDARRQKNYSHLVGSRTDDWRTRDHALRTAWNRFDGKSIPEPYGGSSSDLEKGAGDSTEIARSFALRTGWSKALAASPQKSAATGCPSTFFLPVVEDGAFEVAPQATNLSIAKSYKEGSGYCVIYLDNPVSEPSKANFEASVERVLETYKSVIYSDDFPNAGSYAFDPLVIVADFSQSPWTDDAALKFTGVFMPIIATAMSRPVLFLAADMKTVVTSATSDEAKRLTHATLAHEMHHAVVDYYKTRKHDLTETVAIDEGLAHLMEDLFGYGDENFESFAFQYLVGFADGLQPALDAGPTANSAAARGAAHTFLYYLASRTGGIQFADGSPVASAGIRFIRALVQSEEVGVINLYDQFAAAMKKSPNDDFWMQTVADYFGSLVLDGAKISSVNAEYQAQDPSDTITDLQGNTGRGFGMRFNNFAGLGQLSDSFQNLDDSSLASEGLSQGFYQTMPMIHTLATGKSKIAFEFSTDSNNAVSVVRIK